MSRTQSELFEKATLIAERKIRRARAMQSHETRDMVKYVLSALAAKLYRSDTGSRRNAKAQSS